MAQTQRDSTSFGKTSIVRAEITNRGRLDSDIVRGLEPISRPRLRLSPVAAPPLGGVPVCLRVCAKPLQV
jgi:hypothetical protein